MQLNAIEVFSFLAYIFSKLAFSEKDSIDCVIRNIGIPVSDSAHASKLSVAIDSYPSDPIVASSRQKYNPIAEQAQTYRYRRVAVAVPAHRETELESERLEAEIVVARL